MGLGEGLINVAGGEGRLISVGLWCPSLKGWCFFIVQVELEAIEIKLLDKEDLLFREKERLGWKLVNGARGKRLISGAAGGACKWGWDIGAYKWGQGRGAYKWGWWEGS